MRETKGTGTCHNFANASIKLDEKNEGLKVVAVVALAADVVVLVVVA